MGEGLVSKQSGTSRYLVITAISYKVAVLVMSIINYVTHQYTYNTKYMTQNYANTTQNSWQGSAISDCSFLLFGKIKNKKNWTSMLIASACLCVYLCVCLCVCLPVRSPPA